MCLRPLGKFCGVPRPPAPPFAGEEPHALWHYSEDPNLDVFMPHVPATSPENPPLVWAVDTRHAPMFWFPRDCPRGCVWVGPNTTDEDRERFFGQSATLRLHVIEGDWFERMRDCRLYAYRMPPQSFVEHDEVGGYWMSTETVRADDRVEIDDLIGRHARAGIELRITPSLWPFWKRVAASTLEFSGSRLRNAGDHPDRMV